MTNAANRELLDSEQLDPRRLAALVLSVPIPTIYLRTRVDHFSQGFAPAPKEPPAPLLKVVVDLDGEPIVSPQLLKPNLLYSLRLKLRGFSWPDDADRLHIGLHTTCPSEEYSISEFVLERPKETKGFEYDGQLTGSLKFGAAQSSFLEDLVFSVRAAFETEAGRFQEIPVIGHDELRIRVIEQGQHPLMTGNRRLDRHVGELLSRAISDSPSIQSEIPELLPVLQALTRLMSVYAQEAVFKGQSKVKESEFQSRVLRDLRLQLGQDVQEHPAQAGGITDIRYRGVIIELKVEEKEGDRQHLCQDYSEQPTQYAGVESRQVSVLLVLDLTTKDEPPGDIRNDILLTDVRTHGANDETRYPSKTLVFVVNGNTRNPSEYSR